MGRRVVAIEGDGSLLMALPTLATMELAIRDATS